MRNQWHPMVSVYQKKLLPFCFIALCFLLVSFLPQTKKGKLTLHFINVANGKPIILQDSVYSTTLGEQYTVTKLRYYITNIELAGNPILTEEHNYHLVDAAKSTSFSIPVKEGKYSGIQFLLGVDSVRNFSGAQTGALDPMNDMFWTWNSGYVMFKLEGYADSSFATNNKVEHHIGGYRFGNNVATTIRLEFDEIKIKEDEAADIYIYMNLDAYWAGVNQIQIARDPVCTLPGELAKKIAANFKGLFSVKQVKQ